MEFEKVIYVIGGKHDNSLDTVYTIDTTTGDIAIHSETLPYSVMFMATVIVDNTIYGFGGYYKPHWFGLNTWISYEVFSADNLTESESNLDSLENVVVIDRPTANPTNEPTHEPTTSIPSLSASPTDDPIQSPPYNTSIDFTHSSSATSITPIKSTILYMCFVVGAAVLIIAGCVLGIHLGLKYFKLSTRRSNAKPGHVHNASSAKGFDIL